MLYADWQNKKKLADRLASRKDIQLVPVPVLLQSARLLADDRLPAPLVEHLAATLVAYPELRFGPDDLVVSAASNWRLPAARISLLLGDQNYSEPQRQQSRDGYEVRFRGVFELGNPLATTASMMPAVLHLQWADTPPVRIHLDPEPPRAVRQTEGNVSAGSGQRVPAVMQRQRPAYQIVAVDVGETTLRFVPKPSRDDQPVPVPPEPPSPAQPAAPSPRLEAPVPGPSGNKGNKEAPASPQDSPSSAVKRQED